jgi:hypothetical protein
VPRKNVEVAIGGVLWHIFVQEDCFMGNSHYARRSLTVAAIIIVSLSLAAVSLAGELSKKLTGEVKVENRGQGPRQPSAAPAIVYIQDFELGYDVAQDDGRGKGLPVIGRVLPRLSQRNDPLQKARSLVGLMSDALVRGFSEQKIDARRSAAGTPLPAEGWLIRGVFTEIDQGKRVMRATIGFGAGATEMEVYVLVSDLADQPDQPFVIFGTEKEPGRIPGAVVTMNPYVAAAKFVMQKSASEKDVKKTASQIVDAVVNYGRSLGTEGNVPH